MPPPRSPLLPDSPLWCGPEREACASIAQTVLAFVDKRVRPHLQAWEEAGELPAALHREAGQIGLLGLGFPEQWGGVATSHALRIAATRALCEAGSGGLIAGLMSHTIALPPLLALADAQLVGRIAPAVLRGEQTMALCITEPGGGSDVANLQMRAVRDGDSWLLSGSKAFITTGMRADWLTVAARTGEAGPGGVSLFAVQGDLPGIGKSRLDKTGWRCSDTALLHFDEVRVRADQLAGGEGMAFLGLMQNFNGERLGLAATAWGMAEVCLQDALDWAQERTTFGKPLITRQVIRHKLLEMKTRVEAVRCLMEQVIWRIDRGDEPVAEVCMLKNLATATLEYVAGEAVQILGGGGYIRGGRVERIFRETKVLSIGGGASEVLADLATRQLGW